MAGYSEEQELLGVFQSFQQALLENDLEELDRVLSPDYRGFNLQGGMETRGFTLEAWKPGGASMDEFTYEDLRIDVRGDVGVLTGTGFVAGDFQGEPWEHHVHFCDLYTKTESGWKIFLSHAVEVEPSSFPFESAEDDGDPGTWRVRPPKAGAPPAQIPEAGPNE